MLPLVLLPGMNCTADLWTGCGVDDALTPMLGEQSIDTQVDRLLAGAAAAVRSRRPVARCDRRDGARRPGTGARRAAVPRVDEREGADGRAAGVVADRGSTGSTPGRARGVCRPTSCRHCSHRTRRIGPTSCERTLAMADATGPATLRAQLRMQSTRVDLRPALRDVTRADAPGVGRQDAICPPQFHAEIAAALAAGARGHDRRRSSAAPGAARLPSVRSCERWRGPRRVSVEARSALGGPRLECRVRRAEPAAPSDVP